MCPALTVHLSGPACVVSGVGWRTTQQKSQSTRAPSHTFKPICCVTLSGQCPALTLATSLVT